MTLIENTNRLLAFVRKKHGSLANIANQSDGTVEVEWLKKFAAGKISDPSVNRIQALHDCLKKLNATEAA